jgi:perosamine synthetase
MIRLTKPELSGALEGLDRLLDQGFLVQGELVRRFEEEVAGYVGRGHGVAVNSGTAAIQCALMASGIGPGDEVAIPDFTFPATANAVVQAGASPVLVDIDPVTFNISPDDLERRIGDKVRAVMPVDLFGLAADFDAIRDICARRGLKLIEDSACALGAKYGDAGCGSFGDASVLSFHPRKVVTTGEGGMVLVDDGRVAERVRELRNHGMRYSGGRAEFVAAGFNFRMTEIAALLGLNQMKNLDTMIEKRRSIAAAYGRLLEGTAGVTAPVEPPGRFHSYQAYVVVLDRGLDRDAVIGMLRERKVESTIGTYAVHSQPFYRHMLGHGPGDFPNSTNAMNQSLALPMYPAMTEDQVVEVVRALEKSVSEASPGK